MLDIEYEAKIRVDDFNRIEEKLSKLGAVLIDFIEEEDIYIDLKPCIDMAARDMALRVRIYRSILSNTKHCELTYKGPRQSKDLKIRKEITLAIDNGYKAIDIFRELGFEKYIAVYKMRKIYRYGSAKIFLDDVKGLGKFIEIEIEDVNSIERFRENIMRILDTFDLPKELIPKSYLEMVLEKQNAYNT
uniref:Class IV adenylate cyclase n=1 Tax=Ignisphaera aggregans TaxID=334771 RepID=A0A7J3QFL6_9CREN